MNKKLFIGGVNFKTTDETLKAEFGKAGNVVSAVIIKDRMTGRSKGFAFVEMETEAEAQAATEMWNGKQLDGRTIAVSEARPQPERN